MGRWQPLWWLTAWHKLSARAEFRAALLDYRLLPPPLVPLAALLIPVGEVLLGSPGDRTGPVAGPLSAALRVSTRWRAINLRRGRVHGLRLRFRQRGRQGPAPVLVAGRPQNVLGGSATGALPVTLARSPRWTDADPHAGCHG
jgi:hypothetical protein